MTGSGTANLASLRREVETPFAARVSGTHRLEPRRQRAAGRRRRGRSRARSRARSSISRRRSAKRRPTTIPLQGRVARGSRPSGRGCRRRHYGRTLQLAAHRQQRGRDMQVDRALVVLGKRDRATSAARRTPGHLGARRASGAQRGRLARAARRARRRRAGAERCRRARGRRSRRRRVRGVRTPLQRFQGRGAPHAGGLEARIQAGATSPGTAAWSAPRTEAPNGRIVARLSRLVMPGPAELPSWSGADKAADREVAGGHDRPVAGARRRGRELRVEGARSRAARARRASRAAANGGSRSSRCRTTPDGSTRTGRGAAQGKQQQTQARRRARCQGCGRFPRPIRLSR